MPDSRKPKPEPEAKVKPPDPESPVSPPKPSDPAYVKPADVEKAGDFWRRHAPPEFANLFDAKEDTDAGA